MPFCGSVSGVVCSSRTVEAMGTTKRQHWEKYGQEEVRTRCGWGWDTGKRLSHCSP